MVIAKRFEYHLIKCKKCYAFMFQNYKGADYATCPFNAMHQMPQPEFRHHLANCPDKAMLQLELKYAARKENGEVNILKGCTDTPVYKDLEIPSNEDWDAEITAPVREGPQYDITYYDRAQFKNLSGLNKTQRAVVNDNRLTTGQKMQEFLKNNCKLWEELNNELPNGNAPYGMEEETLSLPKTTSKAAMTCNSQGQPIQQPVSSVFAYRIGRGVDRGMVANRNNNAGNNGQAPGMNAETFVPIMPYGRGMGIGNQPAGAVGIGRGIATGSIGHGKIAPPPGICVPKVGTNNAPGRDYND